LDTGWIEEEFNIGIIIDRLDGTVGVIAFNGEFFK